METTRHQVLLLFREGIHLHIHRQASNFEPFEHRFVSCGFESLYGVVRLPERQNLLPPNNF